MKAMNPRAWQEHVRRELTVLEPLLGSMGYALEAEQPHVRGERYLMKRDKLVLLGRARDGGRVVIKASADKNGIAEIERERRTRDALARLSFANDRLLCPREVAAERRGNYFLLITEFVEQDRPLLARPLEEQFFIALRALEAQEGFHATAYGHGREIKNAFETHGAETYLEKFSLLRREVAAHCGDPQTRDALARAGEFLAANKVTLERYGSCLTHNDFVPHNIRLNGRLLYLLDYAEFWFGNKYEGWARFINYMEVHNPPLARSLAQYVRENRPGEYLALRLMRAYKLGVILAYHARTLAQTEGDLHELAQKRVALWTAVLERVLDDTPVPGEIIAAYTAERDRLRSAEEKKRLESIGAL